MGNHAAMGKARHAGHELARARLRRFLTLLFLPPRLLGGEKWESAKGGIAFTEESDPRA